MTNNLVLHKSAMYASLTRSASGTRNGSDDNSLQIEDVGQPHTSRQPMTHQRGTGQSLANSLADAEIFCIASFNLS